MSSSPRPREHTTPPVFAPRSLLRLFAPALRAPAHARAGGAGAVPRVVSVERPDWKINKASWLNVFVQFVVKSSI